MSIRQGDTIVAGYIAYDDYTELDNKPSINGVVLEGNKTLAELGIASITEGYVKDTELTEILTGYVTTTALTTTLEDYALVENTYTKDEVDAIVDAKDSLPPQNTDTYGKILQSNVGGASWISFGILREWDE